MGGDQDGLESFKASGLSLQRLAAGAQVGDGLVNDDQGSMGVERVVVALADGLERLSAAVHPAGGVTGHAITHWVTLHAIELPGRLRPPRASLTKRINLCRNAAADVSER